MNFLFYILLWPVIFFRSVHDYIQPFQVAVFGGAALLSGVLVELIRRAALRRERFDIPNERSSHTIPTPRGGGLAIVVVTLVGWFQFHLFVWHRFDAQVWAYPIGAVLIAAVSWIDDLRGLSNSTRFAVHSVAAILALAVYGHFQGVILPHGWSAEFPAALGLVLTFLWIVWLTNAYNFMDGIDGIAGLQALVAGLGWFAIVLVPDIQTNDYSHFDVSLESFAGITLLGLLLGASSLGFLLHNRPPARIFMGDVGSAFLGYSFAVMPLLLSGDYDYDWNRDVGITYLFFPTLLFVWPFLFDTIFTFIRRALKRENVFKAHRSHLFQRLVIAGCSHRFVTLLYGFFALEGAFFGIHCAYDSAAREQVPYVYIAILGSMLGLWLFTCWCERRAAKRAKTAP